MTVGRLSPRSRQLTGVCGLLIATSLAAQGLVAATEPGSGRGPIFRFEADAFGLNLHHFLYVLVRAQENMPLSEGHAVAGAPGDQEHRLRTGEPDGSSG